MNHYPIVNYELSIINYKQLMLYLAGICFLFIGALLPLSAQAGALDSPAATTDPVSGMFTITDIYKRLNTGAVATKRAGGFTEPGAGPTAGTGKTLDDVMTLVNSRAHAVCAGTLNGTRWCDNGDGTVTDLTTGLIWLKDASWGGQVVFWANSATGVNAHDKAASLSAAFVGLSDGSVEGDWRLPTFKELKQLTTGTEPILSATMRAFTGVNGANPYWSSTTSRGDGTLQPAFVVDLVNGTVLSITKIVTQSVWPVRGQ